MMYDAAIIGAGPAGLSAAINLKLHNKSVIWFGSKAMSDKVEKSESIANYPGMGIISGSELNEKFLMPSRLILRLKIRWLQTFLLQARVL